MNFISKFKQIFFSCCVFFVLSGNCFADKNSRIDSLKQMIAASKEDSNAVNLYFKLIQQFEYFKSKEKIEYSIVGLELAKKINFTRGIKSIYYSLITLLSHREMYDLSMEYAIQYVSYLEKNKFNYELQKLNNILGNLYANQGKYASSFKYYKAALNYYASINELKRQADILANISILMVKVNKQDSALYYANKSIEYYRLSMPKGNSSLANALLMVADLSVKKNAILFAKNIAKEAYAIYDSLNESHGKILCLLSLSDIYFSEHKKDSAIISLNNADVYINKVNIPSLKSEIYLKKSIIYADLHNFQEAYKYQLLYKSNEDTISSGKLIEKMMELETKYEITKSGENLKQSKRELELKNKEQNFLLIVMSVIALLLLLSIYAFVQKSRSAKIIQQQKKTVEEKQKEILDSITYARRIQQSLLPSEKYINRILDKLKK